MRAVASHKPWWVDILRGRKQGIMAGSLRHAARLASLGFSAGVHGRTLAYRKGWLKTHRLPRPTLCVGNITTGGTGKTPLVIRLATDLMALGLRPAVLLRGYAREHVSRKPVLVRDARGIRAGLQESGDEAMELANRLPGVCVGVGADRYAVGTYLLRMHPVDCFILDDGFQHHRLERDINIVTLDVTDPWGGGSLLPAGLLREPPQALSRADAVVLTRVGSLGPDRLEVLRAEVSMFMREGAGLLESRHEPRELFRIADGVKLPLERLRGHKMLVISAIGNPQAFEDTLSSLGGDLQDARYFRDHLGDPREVWSWVQDRWREEEWIVMTEKDAVRWKKQLPSRLARSVFGLRMDLALTRGQDHWQNLLRLVKDLTRAQ